MASLEDRVAELERRLIAAESIHVLAAPLQVVSGDGGVLAEIGVDSGGYARLKIFNKAGAVVVAIGADGCGGYISFRDTVGERVGYFTTETYGGRLEVNGLDGGGVTIYNDSEGGGINVSHVGGHIGMGLHADADLAKIRVYDDLVDEPILTLP